MIVVVTKTHRVVNHQPQYGYEEKPRGLREAVEVPVVTPARLISLHARGNHAPDARENSWRQQVVRIS